VDQTGDDVRVDQVEVVMGSKDICRNDRCKVASILLMVAAMSDNDAIRMLCLFVSLNIPTITIASFLTGS
jgi:hypothetical protein